MNKDSRCGNILTHDGKSFSTKKEVIYKDGVPQIRCSYLDEFISITEFRYRYNKKKKVFYIEQPSRPGCRKKEWDLGISKPRKIKNFWFEQVEYRLCSELNLFLPINNFNNIKNSDNNYLHGVSKYGKYLENQRNISSTKAAIKNWKLNNKHKVSASHAKRRAMLNEACPNWVIDGLRDQINSIYSKRFELEQNTGVAHHVHHIYPLHGCNPEGVHISCGLHVPWNLVAIPASINMKIGSLNPEYHNLSPIFS